MRFKPTTFDDAWLIEPERIEDERGFFARIWCQQEFASHGLESHLVQSSISFNTLAGTLRGMHFQCSPHEEVKLVRCTHGSIFDVIVDVRAESGTFGQYFACELNSENHLGLYIPKGFAHGFQTLSPNSEVCYHMSSPYHANATSGFHFADPEVDIAWPLPVTMVSNRDQALGNLNDIS